MNRWLFRTLFPEAELRVLNVEAGLYKAGLIDWMGPRYATIFIDSSDWSEKKKKFVCSVRVCDKTGTKRINVKVDSVDEATIREALLGN
jgi:hypothetical protein